MLRRPSWISAFYMHAIAQITPVLDLAHQRTYKKRYYTPMWHKCEKSEVFTIRGGGHLGFWAVTWKAQGENLETLVILTWEALKSICAKIQLSLFFFSRSKPNALGLYMPAFYRPKWSAILLLISIIMAS